MNKLCDICGLKEAIRSESALGTIYHLCTACRGVVDLARKAEMQEEKDLEDAKHLRSLWKFAIVSWTLIALFLFFLFGHFAWAIF